MSGPRPQIVIHDLVQGRAVVQLAAALGRAVQLRSAPDAAAYAGVGYLHALGRALGNEILIDCGHDAGLVMAALRTGCKTLAFSGPEETYRRLADMAAQQGAELQHESAAAPARLLLEAGAPVEPVCRTWLMASDR